MPSLIDFLMSDLRRKDPDLYNEIVELQKTNTAKLAILQDRLQEAIAKKGWEYVIGNPHPAGRHLANITNTTRISSDESVIGIYAEHPAISLLDAYIKELDRFTKRR